MASVEVDPGALEVAVSLTGDIAWIDVDPGALSVETSLTATQYNDVTADPGALSVVTSLTATQCSNVNVDPGALSVATIMTGTFLFIEGPETVTIKIYSGNQLKATKNISTAPEISGDIMRRNKSFVNVQGDHLTLTISNSDLGRKLYLADLHVVLAVIGGR